MDTINFQPTGIYPQFVKNPGLLCAGSSAASSLPSDKKDEFTLSNNALKSPENAKKPNSAIRTRAIKYGLIAGGIILLSTLISKCTKGISAMKLKDITFGDASSVSEFMAAHNSPMSELEGLEKIWNNAAKYAEHPLGKAYTSFKSVGAFIQKHFYDY